MPPKKTSTVQSTTSISDSNTIPYQTGSNKKPTSMVSFSSADSNRLQLAQAINNITIAGNTFSRSIDILNNFSQEKLAELDIQIESKNRQYQDLNAQLENEFKNNQISTMHHLNEFKLKACEDVAKEFNMQVIRNEDFHKLKAELGSSQKELADLNKSFADRLKDEVARVTSHYNDQLVRETSTLTLTHKAQIAELSAQTQQQKKEIEILNRTIENMKHEIAEQRNLTKEVAIAGSKAQIMQQIGKEKF